MPAACVEKDIEIAPFLSHVKREAELCHRSRYSELREWGISVPVRTRTWTDEPKRHVRIKIEKKADLSAEFQTLSRRWSKETSHLSSLLQKVTHDSYQRIIAMGPPAIPLILKEMKRKPGHWFWALDHLTKGENPAEGCGTLTQAAAAWIKWGESKGYL
jgi:hypothetical protein